MNGTSPFPRCYAPPRQLSIPTGVFTAYARRDQTRREHAAELHAFLGRCEWENGGSDAAHVEDCRPSTTAGKSGISPIEKVNVCSWATSILILCSRLLRNLKRNWIEPSIGYESRP